jgi:hypothetical protein
MFARRSRKSDEIDHLLARGRMGGPAREEVLARVLDAQAPALAPWWRRAFAQYWAPVLAAAAILLFAIRPKDDRFTPKGAPSAGPALSVLCVDACRPGSTLAFQVEDARAAAYLTAWAEPVAGGERVWYLEGTRAPVDALAGMQTLKQAVRLGPSQPPGAYRVHLVLSAAPLSREVALGTHEAIAEVVVPLEVTP